MSYYISESNQEILWKAFQKIPDIQSFSMEQKQELFGGTLYEMYDTIKGRVLTKPDIVILNKKTLQSIMEKSRKYRTYTTPVENHTIVNSIPATSPGSSNTYTSFAGPANPIPYFETAEERMKRIFEEKQKQYDQMIAKPNVPKPSELFQEPKEEQDGAIENMDELIKQYQDQRERDISIIPPPPHIDTIESNLQSHSQSQNNHSIQELYTVDKLMEYIIQLEKRIIVLENQMTHLYSR